MERDDALQNHLQFLSNSGHELDLLANVASEDNFHLGTPVSHPFPFQIPEGKKRLIPEVLEHLLQSNSLHQAHLTKLQNFSTAIVAKALLDDSSQYVDIFQLIEHSSMEKTTHHHSHCHYVTQILNTRHDIA